MPTARPSALPTLEPSPLPSLEPTAQPTFAPYRLVYVQSSLYISGFTKQSFTDLGMEMATKKSLVSVLSVIETVDQITKMNVTDKSDGEVIGVDVKFTLEVRLEGVVARTNDDTRRLTTEYSGSAKNLTTAFVDDISSATSSGNLTTALKAASSNVTGAYLNITAEGSGEVETSTVIVEYTRPPSATDCVTDRHSYHRRLRHRQPCPQQLPLRCRVVVAFDPYVSALVPTDVSPTLPF